MKKDIFISDSEAEKYLFDDTIENALQHTKQTCSMLYISKIDGNYYILTKRQMFDCLGKKNSIECLCLADFTDCAKEAEPETETTMKKYVFLTKKQFNTLYFKELSEVSALLRAESSDLAVYKNGNYYAVISKADIKTFNIPTTDDNTRSYGKKFRKFKLRADFTHGEKIESAIKEETEKRETLTAALKYSAESLINEIETFKENQKEPRLCAVFYDNHVFAANLTETEAEKQAEYLAKENGKRVYVLKPDCFFEHAVKRVSIDIFGNESETGYKLDSRDADVPF